MKKFSFGFIILILVGLNVVGFSATPTETPTDSPTWTQTPTYTITETATPSMTHSPTYTETPTATPTNTFSPTSTWTGTFTVTETATPTPSYTVTLTQTTTATVTRTITITPTVTITPFQVARDAVINYPSPAKGEKTWFYYEIKAPAKVIIEIYNLAGELGQTIMTTHEVGSNGRTEWSISDVAPGVYIYTVSIEDALDKRKLGPNKLIVIK